MLKWIVLMTRKKKNLEVIAVSMTVLLFRDSLSRTVLHQQSVAQVIETQSKIRRPQKCLRESRLQAKSLMIMSLYRKDLDFLPDAIQLRLNSSFYCNTN